MLKFRCFTGCISHLSLIIILNKMPAFIHFEAATGRSLQNSCSKSVLNELKYACESVLFLLKLQAIGQQLY